MLESSQQDLALIIHAINTMCSIHLDAQVKHFDLKFSHLSMFIELTRIFKDIFIKVGSLTIQP